MIVISVTVHTPAHIESSPLVNSIHFLDRSMAFRTFHPGSDMSAMIEVNEVRQHMHFGPLNGLIRLIRSGYFLNIWRIGFYDGVTVHTNFQPRNFRERC